MTQIMILVIYIFMTTTIMVIFIVIMARVLKTLVAKILRVSNKQFWV